MSWSGILAKTAVGLGAVAVPMVFAAAGAGQASADPGGICVSGPWGYASVCLNTPGWGWYGGWNNGWDGGWDNGWHGGHGDWEGDD